MIAKQEHSKVSLAAGDVQRRLEQIGTKMRMKCLTRRRNSNTVLTENGEKDDAIKNGITHSLVEMMYSGSSEVQITGVKYIRKLLSSQPDPPINEVIELGLLPILVSLLKSGSENMQYEAAWALTNILSGNSVQVRYVIETGAVDLFIKLLASSSRDVQEQSAWALGNIAGDLDDFREFVLDRGAMPALLGMLMSTTCISLLQIGAWAVCNLCRGNVSFKSIAPAIPVLRDFLKKDNFDFLYNCTFALLLLSKGHDRHHEFFKHEVPPHLIRLLESQHENLVSHSIGTLGNISLCSENDIQHLLDWGILPALKKHFNSPNEGIRKNLCRIVANLTLGSQEQIQEVIVNGFISKLLGLIEKDTESVIIPLSFAIRNITINGTDNQLIYLVKEGAVSKLCYLLTFQSVEIVKAALDSLENLLAMLELHAMSTGQYNPIALTVEECGGIENITDLLNHVNSDIYHKAFEIMEKFFSSEEVSKLE